MLVGVPALQGILGLLEKGAHQSRAQRSPVPEQPGSANERSIGQRKLAQRQTLWPRGRPVRQKRYAEPAVDHHGNEFKTIQFVPVLGLDAGLAQIIVDQAAGEHPSIQPDEWLLRQYLGADRGP